MSKSAPAITTLSSREFNQDTGRAKKAAENGPVIITDRGKQTHVLLSYVDYEELRGHAASEAPEPFISVAEALSHPASADIDFDIPEIRDYPREIDLS